VGEEGEPAQHDLRAEQAREWGEERDLEGRALHEGELEGVEHWRVLTAGGAGLN
jgi:hypothetical protein